MRVHPYVATLSLNYKPSWTERWHMRTTVHVNVLDETMMMSSAIADDTIL